MVYSTPDGKTFTTKEEYLKYMKEYLGITEEDEAKAIARKESAKQKFTQGVFVDKIDTPYGGMHKVVLDLNRLKDNEAYQSGKIIFCIKQSKKGTYYAENMNF